ncbi:hypothetical protein ACFV4K_24780 [Nocardia sp. NPDC059764]|uniref:hypothetical protein n=1 Tax=Nocardia sp. NPDC059764 TaxID=3346939 RepID=UPI0036537A9B
MTDKHDRVEVVLGDLGIARNHWTQASTRLFNARLIAQNDVSLQESEMGLFMDFYNHYKDVPQYAIDRLSEGIVACDTIDAILKAGKNVYEQEEQDNVHAFKNLY